MFRNMLLMAAKKGQYLVRPPKNEQGQGNQCRTPGVKFEE